MGRMSQGSRINLGLAGIIEFVQCCDGVFIRSHFDGYIATVVGGDGLPVVYKTLAAARRAVKRVRAGSGVYYTFASYEDKYLSGEENNYA